MLSARLDTFHLALRRHVWLSRLAIFCRIGLAWGFLPSGMVKILGQQFTNLTIMHPMGHYLVALHRTGWYHQAIGIAQVTAALLLVIPRTVALGAFLYLPIILNICLLSLSVRFEGSLISSPLMVVACLYLLCWEFHKWKYLLPMYHGRALAALPSPTPTVKRFPWPFFAMSAAGVALIISLLVFGYSIVPRNTYRDCSGDCPDNADPEACLQFCDCIHKRGASLDSCLRLYRSHLTK